MNSPRFPSKIAFGSFLVYPSPAVTTDAKKAKDLILALKQDRFSTLQPPVTIVQAVVRILASVLDESPLRDLLGPEVTLVPMPRSAPLVKDAVWPSRSICQALVTASLAREWRPLLDRVVACRKAALCRPADRPTPRQHHETMAVVRTTIVPSAVVLVDDVVTKGATFAGAAARLLEIYPDVEIRAFAVARTSSEFTRVQDPCTGHITIDPAGASSHRLDER